HAAGDAAPSPWVSPAHITGDVMKFSIRTFSALGALAAILACSNDGTPVGADAPDHLKGLKQATPTDSTGNPVSTSGTGVGNPSPGIDTANGNPIRPSDTTPGYVYGVVRASESVQGPETRTNSVRIANVRVAAFPVSDWTSTAPQPNTGPLAAEVFTNANGEFQLPELPAAHYVVTFTPPSGSKYLGVWVTGTINGRSKDYPWWVTLPTK